MATVPRAAVSAATEMIAGKPKRPAPARSHPGCRRGGLHADDDVAYRGRGGGGDEVGLLLRALHQRAGAHAERDRAVHLAVGDLEALVLFALALGVLFAWKGRMAIPALILAAAAWGWS